MADIVAFPFIEVRIEPGPTPPVQRSPGVIAVVGKTPANADGGSVTANIPQVIESAADAADFFAKVDPATKVVTPTTLYSSLLLALMQDPRPAKIYGVRVDGNNYAAALSALEAVDDVAFVSLANEVNVGAAAGANPATNLLALKEHVDKMSADGFQRVGVAMIDPARAKATDYVAKAAADVDPLKSDSSRMIMIAARGATGDAATAAMAAIAGFDPHISIVLKKVRGFSMPKEKQYSPSEIKGLSAANIIPIIDPELIAGESLHFAEGRTFTTDASILYVDHRRVLDFLQFLLKAGLIGLVGDARITKSGMTLLKTQVESILGPQVRRNVIVDFSVSIPVLDILSLPESAWSTTDRGIVQTARMNRTVDMFISVTYGPAVHMLKVSLAMKF